ncbi:MAG: ABC transporter substrate-binding protein [Chloroflexota bacterium]|nr:ABC transporter substrate-binding protein [Chloroflexota bacterium]
MAGKRGRVSKVSVLLAAFGLWLALSACGGGGEEEGNGAEAISGGTVQITMWHSETAANLDTIEGLVRRYNDSQSEVRVKLAYQGTDDEEMAKLVASLRGGEVPTIAYLAEIHAQRLIDSGAITPVQEFIDREKYDLSDFDEKAVKYYTLDGKLWAMPFAMAVPMLYFNKITFREVGLDPEKPPKDLEELREASEKMVKRDANGNLIRAGMAIDITGWYLDLTLEEHGDLYANNDNGRAGRATQVLFNGPTGQAFFQWWHDMVKDEVAINVGRNPTGADTFLTVGVGRAGMTFGSSAALRSVVDVLERGLQNVEMELGVANQPGVAGGTGLPGIYGRALWILKSHPKAEQDAAWKFIKWLMEPEQQAEWYSGSGYLPARVSAFEMPAAKEVEAEYPQFKIAADLYLAAPSTPASLGPLLGPFIDIREIVASAVEEMLVGDKDPIDAINDAAKEANALIEEYNRRVQ